LILLDTHALLWWVTEDRRLSTTARREIARSGSVLVSPVSCWEVGTLVRLHRLELDRDVHEWIADVLDRDDVDLVAMSAHAAVDAGLFPDDFPRDPADRMLYATARELVVPFVSRDANVTEYARRAKDVRVVW
jgi:PIN domain nuclease of toxin-antitoxin system